MLRLILLIFLFLISLLIIFKAPTYHLWLLAILVSEFTVILIVVTGLVLITGIWIGKYQLSGTIFGLLSLFILASPIVKAYIIGKTLGTDLKETFGKKTMNLDVPFSLVKSFNLFYYNDLTAKIYTYSSDSTKQLDLAFYPSKAIGKRPCILVVHGGSWQSGDNTQLPELNTELAHAGYNVAAINYRLAPKYLSPSPLKDLKAAMQYLRFHADELQIDTNNFVLLGRSAGAQIALLAAYTLNDPGIKGVIDFYGPADMVWGYSVPSNPLVMNSRKVIEEYLGGTIKDVPQNYINSSPVNFVSAASVPTLLIHGENDVLVAYEHSIRLQNKLNSNGVKNYFLSLPWATHGFDYHINGPGGQLSTFAVKEFLHQITL